MHDSVRQIFEDAGGMPAEIQRIKESALAVGFEVRDLVDAAAGSFRPELAMAVRVYLCRVLHADMEIEFRKYRTTDG